MCPRATAQHCGDAMASVCSFVEEEYIDLDLSSCGEFEFRVRRSGAADELLCRGRLQPPPPAAAAGPHKAAPPRPGGKAQEVDAGGGGCGSAGRRSAATVAPLQHSHSAGCRDDDTQPVARLRTECSRRRKAARTVHAKLLASRAFFRSLFARTSCSDEQCRGADVRASTRAATAPPGETKSTASKAAFGQIKNGYGYGYGYGYHSGSGRAAPTTLRSSIEQEKLMDEEELAAASAAAARQRKSFSGVIKWRHAVTAAAPAPAAAQAKPLSSSSARRSSCVGGGGGGPALKRSSSARSESEGLIQGAIAYCKRSQQQLGLARKSVSDAAALCSASAPSSWPSNPARSAVVAYCH
ncbi:hypothetical protein BDA96_01G440600 [Sorghum bicolor]|uniref:Uncharacterized protein n=1 Tax=Sorghum bicolor TaxID=4558 RepID=A0A921S567_SORBI|nr:hypothetical protein BDA96_01G440600 [Sorghum bicolor]